MIFTVFQYMTQCNGNSYSGPNQASILSLCSFFYIVWIEIAKVAQKLQI
jgi:hypothetical protein